MDRRTVLAGMGAATLSGVLETKGEASPQQRKFPPGFLWGVATAGHQIEGNNIASDLWLAEQVKPTLFAEPSGDACNSFELWRTDLDLVRGLNLNAYRFSLEWARIEPEPAQFSRAMLDHYQAVIAGCRARGITPVVTFTHSTIPKWLAAKGGWTHPDSPQLFGRFCEKAARQLANSIGYAATLNEPNTSNIVASVFPPQFVQTLSGMNAAAARACGTDKYRIGLLAEVQDVPIVTANLIAAHRAGRAAIKSVRNDLPVGVTLSMQDDEAVGPDSVRDARRAAYYGAWLEVAKGDDFVGVQNYVRTRWGNKGALPPPAGATLDQNGGEVYAPSLANAVRYAHEATGIPVLVSEHGVCTLDDRIRARLIPAALVKLREAMSDGVPVLGYMHWTLVDNFEWFFGFGRNFGLHSLDRTTFARLPRPSATVLAEIAKTNEI